MMDATTVDAAPPPQAASADTRVNLVGLTRGELAGGMEGIGVPARSRAMRAGQLWHWMYFRGARTFAEMTSISKDLRGALDEAFVIGRGEVIAAQTSADGTRKWLIGCGPGQEAESVFIPEEDRGALCVSAQIGCTLHCRFCHTGTQRLVRNLSAAEIVGQVMVARDAYGEWPSPSGGRMLSNVVLMGMGEPLFNYDNVAKSLHIIMDGDGLAISKRRITLSTSGVVPMIERVGAELGVGLAISLHAVRDELRDVLVPINRKYPIAQLLAACRAYPGASNARRITFEYVMLKGVNDSEGDARELARLLNDIPAKINLIPFNKWPGAAYDCSPAPKIKRFSQTLNELGLTAPIRVPRGRDIMAACGQLKSASERARGKKEAAVD